MNILILEDDINRIKKFREKLQYGCDVLLIFDNVDKCIDALKNREWDYLFLDHDLGGKVYVESDGEEQTGWHVAKWLSENKDRMPERIIVHSLNEFGRKNIISLLPNAMELPFAWEKVKIEDRK